MLHVKLYVSRWREEAPDGYFAETIGEPYLPENWKSGVECDDVEELNFSLGSFSLPPIARWEDGCPDDEGYAEYTYREAPEGREHNLWSVLVQNRTPWVRP